MDPQATLLSANLVGANDGLIFEGGGWVAQNGRMVYEAPCFQEGVHAVTVDLDRTRRLRAENTTWRMDQEEVRALGQCVHRVSLKHVPSCQAALAYPAPVHRSFFLPAPDKSKSRRVEFCEAVLEALTLGVGDYFEKLGRFQTLGVALSGGRDSLLCLIIARRFLEKRYAHCNPEERKAKAGATLRAFFFPSRYSSPESQAASEKAAKEFDALYTVVPIQEAFEREVESLQGMLAPGETLKSIALQNLQARIRAVRMWTWANQASGLFLQTSNMSEKAVGYTTVGGDQEGGLGVVANLPKTVVNELLEYLLETTGSEGIALTLQKPASAELDEGQEDEKELMPFPVLDACLALYGEEKMGLDEIKEVMGMMFPEYDGSVLNPWVERFVHLFTGSIYKWVQAPLGLHVYALDLDRERALQLPVVQSTPCQKGGAS